MPKQRGDVEGHGGPDLPAGLPDGALGSSGGLDGAFLITAQDFFTAWGGAMTVASSPYICSTATRPPRPAISSLVVDSVLAIQRRRLRREASGLETVSAVSSAAMTPSASSAALRGAAEADRTPTCCEGSREGLDERHTKSDQPCHTRTEERLDDSDTPVDVLVEQPASHEPTHG